ncbi:hypothetical protein A2Y85_00660 [candidate division WOR-3 bacterium RBG_13_43_14]|uniref:Capsule polysaccharide biosynthesis protein n=1 Tax=candidate division WOR-3 bacterium RBG_13_43_14 TaxID=1802590 RepID=A0A1F4UC68_UNCW3|nr:MAG: hypothetical protein A2Y85_00660 [candidate division WOR-3 bacterium RBG_13_43_14]
MGKATIFRNQKDWIHQIVEFFKNRPERNLIIRAHPDEVWQKAPQKIGNIAKDIAKGTENIYVIEGSAAINTFALMERADVGLAWVSNFGLDMALRGKPVILAAAAQYAYTGLCQTPRTKEEYFEVLVRTADHPPPHDEKAALEGKIYHYIVFKMMSLKSDSENYLAAHYRLLRNGMCPDQDKFYKILAGELSDKGEPLGDGSGKRPPDPFDVYRSVSTL